MRVPSDPGDGRVGYTQDAVNLLEPCPDRAIALGAL